MPHTLINNNLELLNEEVKEILGTPPKWIVRWGNLVLLIFIGLLLVTASIVKRFESVSGIVTITPAQSAMPVTIPLQSIIKSVAVNDGATVKKEDLLITYSAAGKVVKLFASQAGILSFQRLMQNNMRVTSDSLLMLISPINQTYGTFITIPQKDCYRIKLGQQVIICMNNYSPLAPGHLTATVITKPKQGNNEMASIALQLKNTGNASLNLTSQTKANGDIIIGKKRLINTLFSF